MINIQEYKKKLLESKGNRDYITKQLKNKEKELRSLIEFQEDLKQAQAFLQAIAQKLKANYVITLKI